MANLTIRRRNFIQRVLAGDMPTSGIALSSLAPGSDGTVLKVSGGAVTTGKVTDSEITNNTISVAKLVASATSGHVLQSNGSSVTNGYVTDSNIVNDSISVTKITKGTAHFVAKTNSGGTAMELGLLDNNNLSGSANIAVSKLADGTARQILAMNAAGDTPTWTTLAIGATLVVAANDATAAEKASANYVCDGTQDHVEINAAIDALPSTGGKVLLSSGTFNIGITSPGTPIGVTVNKNYTLLEGSGQNTVLKFHASTINSTALLTLSQSYTAARNMRLDGNKTNNAGAAGHLLINVASIAYPVLENIYASESAVYGMFTGSNTHGGVFKNVVVATCQNLGIAVAGCDTTKIPNIYIGCKAISNGAEGFSISSHGSILIGCSADSNLYNYAIATNPYNQLIGCKSRNATIGFYLLSVNKTQVVGCLSNDDATGFQCASGASNNLISGCYAYSASAYGFVVSGTNSNRNHIVGCFSLESNYGIFQIDSNSHNVFEGNKIEDTVGHGIFIGGGSHHVAKNNFILNSSIGSAYYHGLLVQGSDYNTIIGNVVRKGSTSSPYGIYIYSGYYNVLRNNDAILGGATGDFLDSGTSTDLVAKVQVADSSAIHTTAADTAFSVTHGFAPGKLNAVGRVIRVKAWGFYSSTGSPTITLKVKFGSTTLLDFGAITAAVSSSRRWSIDATITVRTLGVSGSVQCEGEARIPTANDNTTHSRPVANSTTTIDTTAAQTLTISATHSVSNAANTITMTQFVAELLN